MQTVTICRPNKRLLFAEDLRKLAVPTPAPTPPTSPLSVRATVVEVNGKGQRGGSDGDVGWLKCCFTYTETVGLLGTGAQDFHLDFHIAPELWNGEGRESAL